MFPTIYVCDLGGILNPQQAKCQLEDLLKQTAKLQPLTFWFAGSAAEPRICISNKHLGETGTVHPGTTLWEPLL